MEENWKVMYDGSLRCQTKRNSEIISTSRDYSCELVSPILTNSWSVFISSSMERMEELYEELLKDSK